MWVTFMGLKIKFFSFKQIVPFDLVPSFESFVPPLGGH